MSEKDSTQLQDDKLSSVAGGYTTMWKNGNIIILPQTIGERIILSTPTGRLVYHHEDPANTPPSPETTYAYYETIRIDGVGLHWVQVDNAGNRIGLPLPWKGLILAQADGAIVSQLAR